MVEKIRLQKFLAHQGVASRRTVEKMITEKRITVDGRVATLGMRVSGSEKISINGRTLKPQKSEHILIAFYKPRGVESTLSSTEGNKSLANYSFGGTDRLYPIGRLDKDSEGLLLMTNDGTLTNELTHPSFAHEKEYVVTVQENLLPGKIENLSNGSIMIGERTVNPARVVTKDDHTFHITLTEGRNRQIRKMCAAVGLTVTSLTRIRIGDITLGKLTPGQSRRENL